MNVQRVEQVLEIRQDVNAVSQLSQRFQYFQRRIGVGGDIKRKRPSCV